MTRDHETNDTASENPAGDVDGRLEQVRAELTGHLPPPDQRLQAMFLTGAAPAEPFDDGSDLVVVEPVSDLESRRSSSRGALAVASIAASFVLLAAGATYAAGRGGSGPPVEIAGDAADEPGLTLVDEPPVEDGRGGDDPGSDDPVDPDGEGTGEGHVADVNDHRDEDSNEHAEHSEGHGNDWEGLFGSGLTERFEALWVENEEWLDCAGDVIEDWFDELDDSDFEIGTWPDVIGECGEPSIGDLGLPFEPSEGFFPELPRFEFEFPDLGDHEMCDVVETDDGVSVTCQWPPCDGDDESCSRFELHDLLPDGWPEGGFELPDMDFGFGFRGGELPEGLDELIPEEWREKLEELEQLTPDEWREKLEELDELTPDEWRENLDEFGQHIPDEWRARLDELRSQLEDLDGFFGDLGEFEGFDGFFDVYPPDQDLAPSTSEA